MIFKNIRPRQRNARNSGGVSVFVKEKLIQNNIIQRICHELDECAVLLM